MDGVAEHPDRFFTEWDDVVDARVPAAIATQDAVILGRGRRFLDNVPSIRLESIRSEMSPTGYLLVDYRVVRQRA